MNGNDRLEDLITDALGSDPDRTPPPERVAALRRHVESRAGAGVQAPVSIADGPQGRRAGSARPTGRRAVLIGGVAASVGAAFGVGATLLASDDEGPSAPPTEPITFASTARGVRTEAALINHTWGTELLLDVEGLPSGQVYKVDYLSALDPKAAEAGSFRSVADTLMRCRFNAAVLRADITGVLVTDPLGAEVLRAELN